MILYIAEKPSLGRAVAEVLPKPHKKGDGFIEAGNGDVVSWCIGHLLEQAQPEAYDPAFKKWSIQDLPIIPEVWKLEVKPRPNNQCKQVAPFGRWTWLTPRPCCRRYGQRISHNITASSLIPSELL